MKKQLIKSRLLPLSWSLPLAILVFYYCPPCLKSAPLIGVLLTLLVIINFRFFISRLPLITHIARLAVGGLFIFSGFIKANDTVGFSYKLKEYFEVFKADSGLNIFEHISYLALPLAVIMCVAEMILGFMLLVGYKRDLTLALLFILILFFTFLTFYSACYNKVTTCGCFGDFLVLKPWESFWKDIYLLILITLLYASKENINPLFGELLNGAFVILALLACITFPIYTIRNLPVFDFRPYAVGMNIKENMKPGAKFQPAKYETILVYKNLKTNTKQEFSNDEYIKSKIWEDTLTWRWEETINKLTQDAVNPPKIADFSIKTLEQHDITDSILTDKNYRFLIICWDINQTSDDIKVQSKLNDLYALCKLNKINITACTASDEASIKDYIQKNSTKYPFVNVDGTVLKTMIRSNPGLILIKQGTIIMNWHYNNLPAFSEIKQQYIK